MCQPHTPRTAPIYQVPQLSTEEEEGLDDAAADVSRSSSPWQQQQQPQQLDGNALVWALKK